MNLTKIILSGTLCITLGSLSACRSESPQVGSQTNWLKVCTESSDCAEFDCICGVCTTSCSESSACGDLDGARCIAATDAGSVAACDGKLGEMGMCLPSCEEEPCADGTECIAGVCLGTRESTATVSIDLTTRYQSLIGFGASLAYDDNLIVNHPEKEALYDALFLESGFDVIRFRNRFDGASEVALEEAAEIISEASSRLGFEPTLFMSSGSPPAELKANGDRFCTNSDVDCTLVRDENGDFDYAAFAEYWRASLEAYEAAGIHPDYVSIQNNPNWVPIDDSSIEACRFLAMEGATEITLPDGTSVDAEFPGYREALNAVEDAVSTLPDAYNFSGPETTTVPAARRYEASLTSTNSVSYHTYGIVNDDDSRVALEDLRSLADRMGQVSMQSEMQANGIDTAVLAQLTLTVAGSSAYLQEGFINSDLSEESTRLMGTDNKTFKKRPTYHALAHFARSTAPGWIRVDATIDTSQVLSSAWMLPNEDALTIILVNPDIEAVNVDLSLEGNAADLLQVASVVRTVFDGVERSADLGVLSPSQLVRLPGQSIVTIAGK